LTTHAYPTEGSAGGNPAVGHGLADFDEWNPSRKTEGQARCAGVVAILARSERDLKRDVGRGCSDGRDFMKARIKWVEDRTFVGESGSGHKLVLGTARSPQQATPGPSPMELVLIGTGGCSAFDVVHILQKGREAVEDCVVELDAERAENEPRVFTRIHMRFVVKGRGLAAAKVERAIQLSVEKYCSASAMLAKTAVITHDFEVVDTN
jgi:putative redox protein